MILSSDLHSSKDLIYPQMLKSVSCAFEDLENGDLLFTIKQFKLLHVNVCLGLKYQIVGKKGY